MKLIQTGERVKGDVISKTGTQMLSRASQSLLNTSNQITQGLDKQADNEFETQFNIAAKEAEEQAGIDAMEAVDSGYTFDEKSEATIYAQQYNKTAETVALANISSTITLKSKELAVKYSHDAQGFQTALKAEVDNFVQTEGLNEKQKVLLNQQVIKENKAYMSDIMVKSLIKQKNDETLAKTQVIESNVNVGMQNLAEGNYPAYAEQMNKVELLVEDSVKEGNITPAQGRELKTNLIKQTNIVEITGKVDRGVDLMLNDKSFTKEEQAGYLKAGNEEIDKWVETTSATGLYSPEELDREESKLRKKLIDTNNMLYKRADKEAEDLVANSIIFNSDKLDYKNKDEKKAVDNFTAQALVDENGNIDYDINNIRTRQFAMELTQSKGIIPTQILSSMRKNSKSTDPLRVISSVDMLMQLQEKVPEVLDQFSEDEIIFATKVKMQMELGMSAEDSINTTREWMRGGDVKEKEQRAILSATNDGTTKAYNKEVNKAFNNFSEDAFDGSGIGGWLKGVFSDPEDNSQAKYDYAQLHKFYLTSTGDLDQATELTNKAIQRSYGVSHLKGSGEVMKFSPELVMNGNNDESEWLQESWNTKREATVKLLRERGEIVKPEDIEFEAGVDTYNGEKIWTLFFTDSGGIKRRVSQSRDTGYWQPNYYDTEVGAQDKIAQEEAKKEAELQMERNKVIFKDNVRIKKFKGAGKKQQSLKEANTKRKEVEEADRQQRLTDYEERDFNLNQL